METLGTKITEGLIELVSSLVFISIVAGLAWTNREHILDFFQEMRIKRVSVSQSGLTFELFEQKVKEAYKKQGLGPPSVNDLERARRIREHLAPIVAGQRVLWVDDQPSNNDTERATLVEMKVDVQACRSTDEAIAEIEQAEIPFCAVISDWHRHAEDSQGNPAGLQLLRRMREKSGKVERGNERFKLPVVFYHGLVSMDELKSRRAEAAALGAVGATGSPGELLSLLVPELVRHALNEPSGS